MNDPPRPDYTHRPAMSSNSRRIVVVGPCAAGKSTLVAELRARGFDALVSGQEHSEIASLWQHANPDVLIALTADISSVRNRRGESWPEWLHDVQVNRLSAAVAAADLVLDTTTVDQRTVVALVVAFLESPRVSGGWDQSSSK